VHNAFAVNAGPDRKLRILSLCTSAGLWDRAWIEAGHEVIAGCEIEAHKRSMYEAFCGGSHLCHDIRDLPDLVRGEKFDGVIGGIPCQSFSKLRSIRDPKFPDLTAEAIAVLEAIECDWFLFENVAKLAIPGASHTMLNAMHYGRPHQSRVRWFTHSNNISPGEKLFHGSVDDLVAYPVVAGRIYGPKRGAAIQGWPEFAKLTQFPCVQLVRRPECRSGGQTLRRKI
jgi:hypothetical protein